MGDLPEPEAASEWLETMTLIRRFEERAGEMYARAKIGGFLHLSIGEEATIVGSTRALRETDYLVSTYRSHGYALARGTEPERVMAELFGRVDGCCGGHGGSMHMFDLQRRFMGGYGIVGGNLPIATGIALSSDYTDTDDVTLCTFGDGASNQGTFGETLNLAALWRLPVVFVVINNQFGMGTSLERHSAVTDLQRKGESLGVPGTRCDGMDVLDTYAVVAEAVERVRKDRRPVLVEAVTYRFRGHSMADPEEYRTKEEVAHWRERDPIPAFGALLEREGILDAEATGEIDREAVAQRRCGGASSRRIRRSRPRSRCTRTSTCSTSARAGPTTDGRAALPRGAERGAARGARARRARAADGRGHRRVRRRLQGHGRPAGGVRRAARARHADLGEHDRRRSASAPR